MNDIVVNDTNIFIDLCKLHLLNELFALPFEIHTVDFVIEELVDENQRKEVASFLESGKLTVHSFQQEEITNVINLKSTAGGNLSFTDCAAWYYAKENNYILVTGDGKLRRKAIASDVAVKGILFLFDKFVEEKVLTLTKAINKLEELLKINARLPRNEIEMRITLWRKHL